MSGLRSPVSGLPLLFLLLGCGASTAPTAAPNFVPAPPLGAEPAATEGRPGAAWLDEVHERLHHRWAEGFLEQARLYLPPQHKLNDPALEATLQFGVAPDGSVRGVEVTKPSGNADFDAAARQVAGDAAPLPPPPADLLSDDGEAHVSWRFARDQRQCGVAGAAVERRRWEPERAVPALIAAGRAGEAAQRVADGLEDPNGDPGKLVPLARAAAAGALTVALTSDKDPVVRVEAARALGDAGVTSAAPLLRKLAAEAPDLAVQAAALRALGALKDQEALPQLTQAATRGDGERSAAAIAGLVAMGHGGDVWTLVAPQLGGADARARAAVLAGLADAPLPAAQDALVAALADRTRARGERTAAAQGLGGLATDAAGKALVGALGDGDAAVRAAALAALQRAAGHGLRGKPFYREAAPLLRDRDPRVQAAACGAVAALDGAAALPDLIGLASRARDPSVAAAAVDAMAGIPSADALTALRRFTAAKDADVRQAALRALARRPEPDGRAAAAKLATDPDPQLRQLGVAAATDADLLRHALVDATPEVRVAAIAPLVKAAGEARAAAPVMRALGDAHAARERVLLAREYLLAVKR
jgi:TonB family protein